MSPPGYPSYVTPGYPSYVTPGYPSYVTPGYPFYVTPGYPSYVTPGLLMGSLKKFRPFVLYCNDYISSRCRKEELYYK